MAEQDQIDQMLDSIDPARNPSVLEGGAPAAPQKSVQDQVDEMLDSIDPRVSGWGPPKGTQQAPESSATGAFIRSAERSALPTAGGLAGAAAGAEAGGALGSFAGPIGTGVGAFAGGVAGSFLGAGAIDSAQSWAISKLPDGVQSLFGGTQEEQKADWERHSIAALLGGVAPYALTMNPGFEARELPANATKLERILNSKPAQAATGGLVMGGITLGQEASQDQLNTPQAWWNIGISTALGMFLNRPNKLGETIMGAGAAPVRSLVSRPEPIVPGAEAETPAPPPTVAEAGDLKVAGPGITGGVYRGTEKQAPAAEAATQDVRRQEVAATEFPRAPDVQDVARQMAADTFARYDDLIAKRDEFRRWIDQANNPPQEAFDALDQRYQELNDQLEATKNLDEQRRIRAPDQDRSRRRIRPSSGAASGVRGRRGAGHAGTRRCAQAADGCRLPDPRSVA
jgi:hypothetical protein